MPEQPVLMENTKINSFAIFNERVYNRNLRFFRKIYKEDVTPAMCKSAGIAVPDYVKLNAAKAATEVTVEVKEVEPVKAPEMLEVQVDDTVIARPDTSGWSEDELRNFTQDNDIPIHPQAKTAGLQAAITRYYDDLEANAKAAEEA